MTAKQLTLIDITVKAGGFPIHHRFLEEHIEGIAAELQRSGITHAEICHGIGLGSMKKGYPALLSDEKMLQIARQAAPQLKLGVYLSSSFHSLAEIEAHRELFDFGRVGVNPDEVEKITGHVHALKAAGKTSIVQLLRVHRFEAKYIAELCERMIKEGADLVYLSDSYGSMDSGDVETFVKSCVEKTAQPIGFQASNATGRAIHNSLTAYRCGATWLDASLSGVGPGNGCAVMEILVAQLQNLGLLPQLDLTELSYASRWQALPAIRRLPRPDLMQLLFAKHRVDYFPEEFIPKVAEILEISPETLLLALQKSQPQAVELRESQVREFLQTEGLDFEVVLHYLKTGEIGL